MHDGAEMAMSHHHHGGHEMHTLSHEGHEMQMEMSMHSTIDLADPMSREGRAQAGSRIRRRCTAACSCSMTTC